MAAAERSLQAHTPAASLGARARCAVLDAKACAAERQVGDRGRSVLRFNMLDHPDGTVSASAAAYAAEQLAARYAAS